MQIGKRSSEWDYYSALIAHIRLAAGDKNAKPQEFHPFANQANDFKQFIKRTK